MALGEHRAAGAGRSAHDLREDRQRHRRRADRLRARAARRARAPPVTSGTSSSTRMRSEVCRCGNVGCLDAVAGGWAIARRMGDLAPTPPTSCASRARATPRRPARFARAGGWSAPPWPRGESAQPHLRGDRRQAGRGGRAGVRRRTRGRLPPCHPGRLAPPRDRDHRARSHGRRHRRRAHGHRPRARAGPGRRAARAAFRLRSVRRRRRSRPAVAWLPSPLRRAR